MSSSIPPISIKQRNEPWNSKELESYSKWKIAKSSLGRRFNLLPYFLGLKKVGNTSNS